MTTEPVRVLSSPFLRLSVYDNTGKLLAATEDPQEAARRCPDFAVGWRPLAPGESYSKMLIITGLYQFSRAGLYFVKVEQFAYGNGSVGENLPSWRRLGTLDDRGGFPVIAEAGASLWVFPFDAGRLKARCEELFAPIQGHGPMGDLSMTVRSKALESVKNDIALPYLDWEAKEWADRYAVRAMRRIGTKEAQKYISALTARNDKVGKAARQALEMPLKTDGWYDIE
jgi:hypothetical protein